MKHVRTFRRCDDVRRYARARDISYEAAERAFRFMGTPTQDFIESLERAATGRRVEWPASRRVGAA